MNVLVLVGSVHVDIGHFVQEWCNTCPQAVPKPLGSRRVTTVNCLLKLLDSIYKIVQSGTGC